MRHDFETGNHGILEAKRRTHGLVQDAVDTQTNPKILFVRLNMNIRSLLFDSIHDDQVDHLDNGGLGGGFQGGGIIVLVGLARIELHTLPFHIGQGILEIAKIFRFVIVLKLAQTFGDGGWRGHMYKGIKTGHKPDIVNRQNIIWLGNGQKKLFPLDKKGRGIVFFQQIPGNQAKHGFGNEHPGWVHGRNT